MTRRSVDLVAIGNGAGAALVDAEGRSGRRRSPRLDGDRIFRAQPGPRTVRRVEPIAGWRRARWAPSPKRVHAKRAPAQAPHDEFCIVRALWYFDALAAMRRAEETRPVFLKVVAPRNSVGLLSQDIDPATGELRGNFPKTHSRIGILACATRLPRGREFAH